MGFLLKIKLRLLKVVLEEASALSFSPGVQLTMLLSLFSSSAQTIQASASQPELPLKWEKNCLLIFKVSAAHTGACLGAPGCDQWIPPSQNVR